MSTVQKSYRYIRRIDRNGTHSWHVTIRRAKQAITKHFSDNVYEGKQKALEAAIRFRDALLKKLDTDDYALWKRRLGCHNRNTSGTPGVGRYVNKYTNNHGVVTEYPSWQAFWKDKEGKRHIRTFGVSTYGEEQARELAIEARANAMRSMFGREDLTQKQDIKKTEEAAQYVHTLVKHHFLINIIKSSKASSRA